MARPPKYVNADYFDRESKRMYYILGEKAVKKMEKAKKMLLDGLTGVKIAEKLGYSHSVSFFTVFKRITGKTTREFVRENS